MPSTDDDAVLYHPATDDGVGTLLLNRPEEKNTMSLEGLAAFARRVDDAAADPGLRCLVVTGEGRSFCAGANLRRGFQTEDDGRAPHERSYAFYTAFLKLLDLDVPVVGALNGHAVGGGFGLALVCDLRIARRDAKYGANFTRLGLHPGMAVSYLLPRLVGLPKASEWLYTGRLFGGDEGAAAGLFNASVAGDEVVPRSLTLARSVAANAPIAVRTTKRSVLAGLGWDPKAAAYREAYAQAMTIETEDASEGIAAMLEKRDPVFRGR
jgi:enoyl-CoA hydratase